MNEETVTIIVQLPKSWCLKEREEAKKQGKVWSTYVRERITDLCLNDMKKTKKK